MGLFKKKKATKGRKRVTKSTTPPLLAIRKTANKNYFCLGATACSISQFFVAWSR
jgi:hypothetical protein